MTPAQRARRLRQIDARRESLTAELRTLIAEARALENEQSWAMGYRVPLRGAVLIAAMDRAAVAKRHDADVHQLRQASAARW
ncbi:hypothetical protein [Sphingomonas sp. HMP6]|uniref:hypothetical protein n=1 Tax=Sphingomonas sp. HMP6 TaxID=1517551 RepID=UPI001596C0F9|nr:hypothetical protein [Sphingomonas sp. HMP6]BCA57736.1 hypothetical protein HMP06_0505 [Sphingomonas sp. HMP6]